ncbi:MAG: alginate biosynthesis protein [Pseudomonadota bacterium]
MKRTQRIATCLVGAFIGVMGLTQPAAAESNYRCSGLEQNRELPSIEGRDGVFFRINADLRMNHPFSDQTVAYLAELSQALADHGTTLIYVPIPTKSVTMPDHLPDAAPLYGFDLEIATHVHDDILKRLTAAGVVTVDARTAMMQAPNDDLAFFKADFHWSASGAREAARAIADVIRVQPGYDELTKTTYETTPQDVEIAFSGMRRLLQTHCLDTLPEAETMTYETTQSGEVDLGGGLDLFGDSTDAIPVALAGTSFSDSPINNFPGFIAEYAELEVINYAITGGNQYGAMISYLTSVEFQEARPKFLIWENPIYNNLAQFGDQPMRELIAAAGRSCTTEIPVQVADGLDELSVDLSGYGLGPEDTLLVDTNRSLGLTADFEFHSAAGLTRTKTIVRGERLTRTGRFYMPLSGLWPEGAASVTVSMDRPFSSAPTVYVCHSTSPRKEDS